MNSLRDLSARLKHAAAHAQTEEATKMSVVVPFIQALGFDAFNLEEVVPEFVADVGIKKGQKIDYALKIDGKIAVLIEAKPITMALGAAQYSQLYRYFGVTVARLAILTNGKEFWFFSDIDEKNKMDKKPFFTFDLQPLDDTQIGELARFQKSVFAMDAILEAASSPTRTTAAAAYLKKQLAAPDDEFVRLVGRQIHEGTLTKIVIEELRPAIQAALDSVIRNRIQERLGVTFSQESAAPQQTETEALATVNGSDDEIETTSEEQLAFMIVRAIGSKIAAVDRITVRDAKSYCAVFMDDNNRRPIARFHFNAKSTKSIGLFNAEKVESRHQVASPTDLYKYAAQIGRAVAAYATN